MGCWASYQSLGKHFHEHYELGEKLGAGSFGQVRACRGRFTGDEHAVKILMRSGRRISLAVDARMEISVWRRVGHHKHCVLLVESYEEAPGLIYMVMERCSVTLMSKLLDMATMTEAYLSRIFREMLLGIAHVHSVRVVHRDIKPDNFLFGGDDDRTIKLADFGLAARLPTKKGLKGIYGTAPYMSPEMLQQFEYGFSTDMWSYGATLYALLYGDCPYSPQEKTAATVKRAIAQGFPEPTYVREEGGDAPELAVKLVKSLLQRDAVDRPSASKALAMPFLQLDAGWCGPTRSVSLVPSVRDARKVSRDYKMPVDPSLQRKLDELLERLQKTWHATDDTSETLTKSISDPAGKGAFSLAAINPAPADGRIAHRTLRHSTHSGVVSDTQGSCDDMTDAREAGLARNLLAFATAKLPGQLSES